MKKKRPKPFKHFKERKRMDEIKQTSPEQAFDIIRQTILKGVNTTVEGALLLDSHLNIISQRIATCAEYEERVIELETVNAAQKVNIDSLSSERARLQERIIELGGSISDDDQSEGTLSTTRGLAG
jgi:hypothetical protein